MKNFLFNLIKIIKNSIWEKKKDISLILISIREKKKIYLIFLKKKNLQKLKLSLLMFFCLIHVMFFIHVVFFMFTRVWEYGWVLYNKLHPTHKEIISFLFSSLKNILVNNKNNPWFSFIAFIFGIFSCDGTMYTMPISRRNSTYLESLEKKAAPGYTLTPEYLAEKAEWLRLKMLRAVKEAAWDLEHPPRPPIIISSEEIEARNAKFKADMEILHGFHKGPTRAIHPKNPLPPIGGRRSSLPSVPVSDTMNAPKHLQIIRGKNDVSLLWKRKKEKINSFLFNLLPEPVKKWAGSNITTVVVGPVATLTKPSETPGFTEKIRFNFARDCVELNDLSKRDFLLKIQDSKTNKNLEQETAIVDRLDRVTNYTISDAQQAFERFKEHAPREGDRVILSELGRTQKQILCDVSDYSTIESTKLSNLAHPITDKPILLKAQFDANVLVKHIKEGKISDLDTALAIHDQPMLNHLEGHAIKNLILHEINTPFPLLTVQEQQLMLDVMTAIYTGGCP